MRARHPSIRELELITAAGPPSATSPPPPRLLPLILSSLVISLPVSSTFLFIAVFVDLLRDALQPSLVIYGSLPGGLVGYMLYSVLTGPVKGQTSLTSRRFIMFCCRADGSPFALF